jgi:hypothetical protein
LVSRRNGCSFRFAKAACHGGGGGAHLVRAARFGVGCSLGLRRGSRCLLLAALLGHRLEACCFLAFALSLRLGGGARLVRAARFGFGVGCSLGLRRGSRGLLLTALLGYRLEARCFLAFALSLRLGGGARLVRAARFGFGAGLGLRRGSRGLLLTALLGYCLEARCFLAFALSSRLGSGALLVRAARFGFGVGCSLGLRHGSRGLLLTALLGYRLEARCFLAFALSSRLGSGALLVRAACLSFGRGAGLSLRRGSRCLFLAALPGYRLEACCFLAFALSSRLGSGALLVRAACLSFGRGAGLSLRRGSRCLFLAALLGDRLEACCFLAFALSSRLGSGALLVRAACLSFGRGAGLSLRRGSRCLNGRGRLNGATHVGFRMGAFGLCRPMLFIVQLRMRRVFGFAPTSRFGRDPRLRSAWRLQFGRRGTFPCFPDHRTNPRPNRADKCAKQRPHGLPTPQCLQRPVSCC